MAEAISGERDGYGAGELAATFVHLGGRYAGRTLDPAGHVANAGHDFCDNGANAMAEAKVAEGPEALDLEEGLTGFGRQPRGHGLMAAAPPEAVAEERMDRGLDRRWVRHGNQHHGRGLAAAAAAAAEAEEDARAMAEVLEARVYEWLAQVGLG